MTRHAAHDRAGSRDLPLTALGVRSNADNYARRRPAQRG